MSDVDWADTLADTILSTLANGGDAGNVRQLLRTHCRPALGADQLYHLLKERNGGSDTQRGIVDRWLAAYDAATGAKGGGG